MKIHIHPISKVFYLAFRIIILQYYINNTKNICIIKTPIIQ
jgi:hypothetical protein